MSDEEVIYDIRVIGSRYVSLVDMVREANILGMDITLETAFDRALDLQAELRRRGLWPLAAGFRMKRGALA